MDEAEKSSDEDVIDFLKEQREKSGIALEEFAPIVWEALMNSIDWSQRQDQIESQALKEVKVCKVVLVLLFPVLNFVVPFFNYSTGYCSDFGTFLP